MKTLDEMLEEQRNTAEFKLEVAKAKAENAQVWAWIAVLFILVMWIK